MDLDSEKRKGNSSASSAPAHTPVMEGGKPGCRGSGGVRAEVGEGTEYGRKGHHIGKRRPASGKQEDTCQSQARGLQGQQPPPHLWMVQQRL